VNDPISKNHISVAGNTDIPEIHGPYTEYWDPAYQAQEDPRVENRIQGFQPTQMSVLPTEWELRFHSQIKTGN